MSSLILPNQWTSQPQYPVQLDRNNSLGAKVVYASTLAGVAFDAATGKRGVTTATTSLVTTRGVSLNFNGTSAFVTLPTTNLVAGYPLTVSCWFEKKAAASGVIYSLNGSGYSAIAGRTGTNLIFNSGSSSANLGYPYTSIPEGWNHLTVVHRAGSHLIFLNGTNVTSSEVVGSTYNWGQPAAGNHSIGNRLNGSSPQYFNGGIQDFIVFRGELSDSEAQQVYQNPWQIFKSQSRRIWVAGAGGLTLIPSLYVDSDTFYSPTVSPGAVTLSHSLFADADTFYAATVTPGAIALSPSLIVDADTFYAATVMPGGVNLAPALLSSTNTFYSPTVSAGSVNISPSLFNDADTFYIPTVSLDGSPQTLTPGLFVDSDTFYSATVAAGGVTLNPSLFVDADTFYIPTASLDGAPQNLTPSLYVDADTFYSPVVSSSGSQNLSPGLFVDADIFYSFSMVNGGFAKRGEYDNSQSVRRMHIQESKRSNIQT